jgi:trehalose-phosphatase
MNFHDFLGDRLKPPAVALHCLAALSADPRNVVHVLSGRTATDMQATLGSVPRLGLIAELGHLQLPPTANRGVSLTSEQAAPTGASPAAGRDRPSSETSGGLIPPGWVLLHRDEDVSSLSASSRSHSTEALAPAGDCPVREVWRATARRVIREYTTHTSGSYEKHNVSALLWCYHDADPDYGRFQARSLVQALREKLGAAPVTVSHNHNKALVEVRLAGVNKGTAVDRLICQADAENPVDFILCIGDDDDDEYMLSATAARSCSPALRERLQGKLFTATVGTVRASSHAHYFATDASQVLALLESLKQTSSSR